jgi:hypothetical protein
MQNTKITNFSYLTFRGEPEEHGPPGDVVKRVIIGLSLNAEVIQSGAMITRRLMTFNNRKTVHEDSFVRQYVPASPKDTTLSV